MSFWRSCSPRSADWWSAHCPAFRRRWRRRCSCQSLSISRRSRRLRPSLRPRPWPSSPAISPARSCASRSTPASAAYTDEAYAMTRKGQPEMALGICVWFSALGGIAGTLADRSGAATGRDGAQLLYLRVFLAGIPRPHVRDHGRALLAGEGDRQHAARAARCVHRHREPAGTPASPSVSPTSLAASK